MYVGFVVCILCPEAERAGVSNKRRVKRTDLDGQVAVDGKGQVHSHQASGEPVQNKRLVISR